MSLKENWKRKIAKLEQMCQPSLNHMVRVIHVTKVGNPHTTHLELFCSFLCIIPNLGILISSLFHIVKTFYFAPNHLI